MEQIIGNTFDDAYLRMTCPISAAHNLESTYNPHLTCHSADSNSMYPSHRDIYDQATAPPTHILRHAIRLRQMLLLVWNPRSANLVEHGGT